MIDMNRIVSVLVKYLPDIPLLYAATTLLLVLFVILTLYLANEKRILRKLLRENIESYEQQSDYLEWLQDNKDRLSKGIVQLNNSSQEKVAATEARIAGLIEENKTYLERTCSAEKRCGELQSTIATLSEKVNEIPQLRKYTNDLTKQNQKVNAEIAAKDALITQLQETRDDLQRKISENKQQVETLELKLQEAQLRLRTAHPASTATKVYKKLQESCAEKDDKITSLSEENCNLRHGLDDLKALVEEKEREITSLETKITVLLNQKSTELPPQSPEDETPEVIIREKNEQILRLQATNRKYYHDVHELEQQVKDLTEQLKSTQQKLSELRDIPLVMETNEYKILQAKCESRDFQIQELQKRIYKLQTDKDVLEDQLRAYRDRWDREFPIGENPYDSGPDNIYRGNLYKLSHDEDE